VAYLAGTAHALGTQQVYVMGESSEHIGMDVRSGLDRLQQHYNNADAMDGASLLLIDRVM